MDKGILLKNLVAALGQFEAALRLPAEHEVMKAGCIQYFEFCFELAWKTVKAVAEDEGVTDCNSPKSALKFAFKKGWLKDENVPLDMLSARNRMAHTYSAADAMTVYDKLPEYLDALQSLVRELEGS